jgi:prepilin-type N-terminal cleavage/methylation domain-containing protein
MSVSRRGFTLLEIAIAITIGVLLLSLAVIVFSRFLAATEMDQISEEAVSVLREARDKTLAREDNQFYGVRLASSTFTLFRAPTYSAGDPNNVSHSVPNGFSITNISLSGGGTDVIFQPLSGNANTAGTFVVAHDNDVVPSTTIRMYANGTIGFE